MKIVYGIVATPKQEKLIREAERYCISMSNYCTLSAEMDDYARERDEKIWHIMGCPPLSKKRKRFDFSKPWYNSVNAVGVIVGAALLLLAIALFTFATRDVCWIGTEAHPGYGSCSQQ